MRDTAGVEETIRRIGQLMHARSPAFADEFVADAILVGSEAGEVARGREAIRALIATFHASDARYSWAQERIDVSVEGGTAWLFAEGQAVKEAPTGERTHRPYRLSGVLRSEGARWLWCLFHGSEPKAGA